MKTKELIKDKGRELFNTHGVMNVTLREVAKQLDKSYGNITYHYKTKPDLIQELFEDLNNELSSLQLDAGNKNLLDYFLILPGINYDITRKYLFFTKDHVELNRNYPELFEKITKMNTERGKRWFELLLKLQKEGYLREDLSTDALTYILFASFCIRNGYFQITPIGDYDKQTFVQVVNQLLLPYLSESGMKIYTGRG